MDKTKRKHGDMPLYTFKPGKGKQVFIIVLTLFMVWHFTFSMREFSSDMLRDPMAIGFVIFFILIYAIFVLSMFLVSSQKLLIYEDGIEHYYGNRRTFTAWDKLSHFEWRKQGRSSVTGIVTHEPMEQTISGGTIERLIHYKWDMRFLELSSIVNLPTRSESWLSRKVDTDKLSRTDFGKVLLEYAPHLFEKGKSL